MLDPKFKTTYCSNIHPLKGVDSLFELLNTITLDIAEGINTDLPFNLGLWLPSSALNEALSKENISYLKNILTKNNFKPITFNAFPMNIFHGEPVKAKVYQPDWSQKERLDYTIKIAELSYALGLKETTISTLSGGYKPNDSSLKKNIYLTQLIKWVLWARSFESKYGFKAQLALEPEPFNTLEDENDILLFWQELEANAKKENVSIETINRYLGICLDTCHFSVRYKSPLSTYYTLKKHQIPVFKAQLSIAPRWNKEMGKIALDNFFNLDEPVYLHQSYARDINNNFFSALDLDIAKKMRTKDIQEWRTHFHIPIFLSKNENTTGSDLIEFLEGMKKEDNPPLLEIETYSFNALKDMYKIDMNVKNTIIKELLWLQKKLTN